MIDTDFTYCSFIKNELCFLTYDEFCRNAKILQLFYEDMSKEEKIFYKWYVYANIHIDENGKNAIWEYLNSPTDEMYQCLKDKLPKYVKK